MMWPPIYTFVLPLPVVCLDERPKKSRAQRRRARYGRQHRWDAMAGKISPKALREAGV